MGKDLRMPWPWKLLLRLQFSLTSLADIFYYESSLLSVKVIEFEMCSLIMGPCDPVSDWYFGGLKGFEMPLYENAVCYEERAVVHCYEKFISWQLLYIFIRRNLKVSC